MAMQTQHKLQYACLLMVHLWPLVTNISKGQGVVKQLPPGRAIHAMSVATLKTITSPYLYHV